ncbi:MAG: alkaline phosphatase D family protein [Streptosporangiales bacterium]
MAKITGSSARLAVSRDVAMTDPVYYGPVTPTSEGIADLNATGLDPDTQYWWAIEDTGVLDTQYQGKAHTHGPVGQPYSYTFAAFACAGGSATYPGVTGNELDPDHVSNHPSFDRVRGADPLFVAHLGDLHYYNLGGPVNAATIVSYRRAYDDVLLQPRQHQLYREVPLVYNFDDHDFGPNNSDRTAPGRDMAAQVYRERVPSYPLAQSTGGVFHSFQVGRVLHVVSDDRYDRDPDTDPASASKTMLGAAQKAWLDNLLASSDAEALVWHMGSLWMGDSTDSWAMYADERDELVDMFRSRGWADRMCIVSGDMHALAIDSGAGNHWGHFPVFQFASIDSGYGGMSTAVYDLGGSGGRGRYGLVTVADDGTSISISGDGFIDGVQWKSHTFWVPSPLISITVPYAGLAPPLEPTEDDQNTHNDVTVSRDGGSSARVQKDTGSLSTADVGVYDTEVTINAAGDASLRDQAGWRVHMGTVDEARYPTVTVNLAHHSELTADVTRLDTGGVLSIGDPPHPLLPPGDVDLLVQGYEETLDPVTWQWQANTTPYGPWRVGVAGDPVLGRADTDGSQLAAAVDETATSLSVEVTDGSLWTTDSGDMPFDVECGGETVTVTGITGAASPQAFTVIRSVNGVVVAHDAGEVVRLAHPAVIAL